MSAILGQEFPPDHRFFGKFAVRSHLRGTVLVTAGVPTDVWPFPGTFADFTKTGKVSIVSSSVEDNPTGSGIGSVTIVGCLDPSLLIGEETIPLDGITPVLSANDFKNPLAFMDAASVGSGGDEFDVAAAAGNIVATIDGANSDQILAGQVGNRSISPGVILPASPDGPVTAVIDRFTVSIGVETTGKGQITLGIFIKRGAAPPLIESIPLSFETEVTADVSFESNIVLLTGDVTFVRVIESSKNVRVSIDLVSNTWTP